ncbi:hypothetical protein [Fictibacillus nanhaiensis]|uniref:hypothetical protein n=1 Tax=Fictibacillus nanhaiensis TaxID=742169 RepID=UPI003C1B24F3
MGFFKKAVFSFAKEMDKQRRKDHDKSLKQREHDDKRQYYYNVAGEKFDEINQILDESNKITSELLDTIIIEDDYYV